MCLHGLDELGQDAAGGLGVQERDLRPPDAGPRRLVDQPQPRLARRAAARRSRPRPGRRRGAGPGPARRGTAPPACPRRAAAAAPRGSRRRRAARPRRPAPRSSRGARAACRTPGYGARSRTRGRRPRPRCGRCGRTRRASVSSRHVRIALVANRASGARRSTPRRLSPRCPSAEVFGLDAPRRVRRAPRPDRGRGRRRDDRARGRARRRARRPARRDPERAPRTTSRAPTGIPLDRRGGRALARDRHGAARRSSSAGSRTGRPFVNVASAGLASSVAGRRAQPLKSRFGPLAYGMGAARAAATGAPAAHRASASTAAEVFDGDAWQVMVACTGAFGGGSGIGAADATDGDLDVVIVPAGSRLGLARRAWGLRTQTIERQRAVPHFEGRVVEVDAAGGRRAQLRRRVRRRRPGARDRARERVPAGRAGERRALRERRGSSSVGGVRT